jgi:hypothetical protein
LDILDAPYDHYSEALTRAQALETNLTPRGFPPERIYNMYGDVLLAMGNGITRYAAIVADLEGVRRLTLVAAKLRSKGVSIDAVASHLGNVEERNPYNNQPFTLDSAQNQLIFNGLSQTQRHYTVLY